MTFLFASASSAVATRPASPAPMTMTSASTAPSVVGSLRVVASHIPQPSRVQRAMRAPLTDRSLAHGARALGRVDSDLAGVLTRHGRPPLWGREPGFATLVQIILEQQVSLASGRAAFSRLERVAGGAVTPRRVARLSEVRLRSAGLTRQKAAYIRALAVAIARPNFPGPPLA